MPVVLDTGVLSVPPVAQRTGMCGPASLKAVLLHYFGTAPDDKTLEWLCGADSKNGTTGHGLVVAASMLGLHAHMYDESTLEDLELHVRAKVPVIVDWFSENDGHYSVVAGIDQQYVYLVDPEVRGLRKIERGTFNRCWFDFNGDSMRTAKDLILRRMIVIIGGVSACSY